MDEVAQDPTAEDSARHILQVFIALSRRRGAVLRMARFKRRFGQAGHAAGDFQAGMNFAMAQGWIEPALAAAYRLTDTGFAEALASSRQN